MESPYMLTTLNVFAPMQPCARHAARVSVGFSREDDGDRKTLLCLWRAKGALMAELVLTEAERLDLTQRLVEAAPPRRTADDEEQDDEPNGEES